MKTLISSLILLTTFALPSLAFADLLVNPMGTLTSGITYTVMNGQQVRNAAGADGIEADTNMGQTVMITFSAPVDLTISNTDPAFRGRALFDDVTETHADMDSNIFAADMNAGTWAFTAGADPRLPTRTGAGTGTFTFGSLGRDAAGNNLYPNSTDDWGQLDITNISKLTWTTIGDSNYEPFRFDAVASSVVPEPSSAALLCFVALGFMGRRRRIKV